MPYLIVGWQLNTNHEVQTVRYGAYLVSLAITRDDGPTQNTSVASEQAREDLR